MAAVEGARDGVHPHARQLQPARRILGQGRVAHGVCEQQVLPRGASPDEGQGGRVEHLQDLVGGPLPVGGLGGEGEQEDEEHGGLAGGPYSVTPRG